MLNGKCRVSQDEIANDHEGILKTPQRVEVIADYLITELPKHIMKLHIAEIDTEIKAIITKEMADVESRYHAPFELSLTNPTKAGDLMSTLYIATIYRYSSENFEELTQYVGFSE